MKRLIALLAVIGLSGCVAYGVPYGAGAYYDNGYYGGSPYYGYGTGYYGYGSGYGYGYGSGVVIEQRPAYIYGGGTYRYGDRRGSRDRDHDGVADRYDRDRDGDGVPNRRDAYPGDPRRH